MLNLKKSLCSFLCVILLFSCICPLASGEAVIKNIIYMIPDGGGMAPFFLADTVKATGGFNKKFAGATSVEKSEMYIKQYLVGAETTYSGNSKITDSAAAGTALSSGYKTNNGMIGITPDKKPHANILEVCQALGKNTGIVVTYEWSNATPAAFSAHAESRNETLNIAEQAVHQGLDVCLGNTLDEYKTEEWFSDEYLENLGYDIIKTKDSLEAVSSGDRIWGKLAPSYYDIEKSPETPNLAELTRTAITALDDGNENGFFLMVEGSAVDGGGHSSDAVRMVSEFIAFDEACRVAIEYAKTRNDTIVVIAPDHDTGGMVYPLGKSLSSIVNGIRDGINPGEITWEGLGGHTSRDGGVFIYLPSGIDYPKGIDPEKIPEVLKTFTANYKECPVNRINNTDITPYLADLLGADLKEHTKELFVDVTDKGEYNPDTETFTFTNENGIEVSIERNTSVAFANGERIDLDGQIAVFLGERFYVPEDLIKYKGKEEISFSDVLTSDWFYDDVKYTVGNGLFSGTSDSTFSPYNPLTRGMLVTVLYRLEGEPKLLESSSSYSFDDVKSGSYYEDAVFWAKMKGIVGGVSEKIFAPDSNITREELASIIYRYAKYKGYDTSVGENTNILSYDDFSDISEYAIPALQYTAGNGIMAGKTASTLNPKDNATRAEAAAILHRFAKLTE